MGRKVNEVGEGYECRINLGLSMEINISKLYILLIKLIEKFIKGILNVQ